MLLIARASATVGVFALPAGDIRGTRVPPPHVSGCDDAASVLRPTVARPRPRNLGTAACMRTIHCLVATGAACLNRATGRAEVPLVAPPPAACGRGSKGIGGALTIQFGAGLGIATSNLVAVPGKSHGHGWTKKFSAVRSDYFVTVVDFAPVAEADGAFRAWLVEHRLDRDDIAPGDLVTDSRRSEGRIVRRYRVHSDAIPD